ncbi:hypothetical protein HYW84_03870 [Candidatus Peregrinibacteria bacterium]|nr:hypothetical protein [Candidatus Peregrinibacteria bacterium]
MNKGIPEADSKLLEEKYSQSPAKIADMDPRKFVDNIAWRLYTEWCCDPANAAESYRSYDGQAYRQWVEQETHYAMQRRRNEHPQGGDVHQQVRTKIVEAVVSRAIELFSDWEGHTYPKNKEDKRNLRASLQPYIDQRHEVTQKPDGEMEVVFSDSETVMVARGTTDRPLPELVVKNPRRAAELVFASFERAADFQRQLATSVEAVPMPDMPENSRSVTVNVPENMDARAIMAHIMMTAGCIVTRSGNQVSAAVDKNSFPMFWKALTQVGLSKEHICFN